MAGPSAMQLSPKDLEAAAGAGRPRKVSYSQLAADYVTGSVTNAVAQKYGVSRQTVLRAVRQTDNVVRERKAALPEEEVCRAYAQGATCAALAQRYKVSLDTIFQFVKQREISPPGVRAWRHPSDVDMKTVIALYDAGMSRAQIQRDTGCPHLKLNQILVMHERPLQHRALTGAKHPRWTGGRMADKAGYIRMRVPDEHWLRPYADKSGHMLEHRFLMAQALGRPLKDAETVHHVNGKRADNRLENLQLLRKCGKGHTAGARFRCRCCGSFDIESVPFVGVLTADAD